MLSPSRPVAHRVVRLLAPLAIPLFFASTARGDDAATAVAIATPATAPKGLAVVAVGDAAAVAWPLAQRVYGTASLRPTALDEPRARVLAGEAPTASDGADVRDLAEMRAALKGDDAPSRAVLTSIARLANVRGLVVVTVVASSPSARVFVADGAAFDSATFAPDPAPTPTPAAPPDVGAPAFAWNGAVRSLTRSFGDGSPATPSATGASVLVAPAAAPSAALAPVAARPTDATAGSHPFYTSPWFWGAVGAAAFGTAAVYLGTRDNSPTTIHLQMQVPK